MINFASKFTSLVLLLLMKKRLFLLLTLCCFGTLSAQQRIEMSLDEAFKLADENSQQIKISITGYEASQESMRSASSQRLPDAGIEISGSYIGTASVLSRGFSNSGTTTIPYAIGIGEVKNGTQPTPHWGNDFVARVTQVIFAGGGISAGIELAEQGKRNAGFLLSTGRLCLSWRTERDDRRAKHDARRCDDVSLFQSCWNGYLFPCALPHEVSLHQSLIAYRFGYGTGPVQLAFHPGHFLAIAVGTVFCGRNGKDTRNIRVHVEHTALADPRQEYGCLLPFPSYCAAHKHRGTGLV